MDLLEIYPREHDLQHWLALGSEYRELLLECDTLAEDDKQFLHTLYLGGKVLLCHRLSGLFGV